MTPTERAAIEARLAAALRGPWTVHYEDRTAQNLGFRAIVRQADPQGGCRHGVADATGWSQPNAEAELIAHAPTDLRTLLDALAEAEARVPELEGAYTPKAGAEAEDLRQRIEQYMLACGSGAVADALQRILDGVDARDALRWLEERDALIAERDELAQTLANERGEGPPPSEGWTYSTENTEGYWRRELGGEKHISATFGLHPEDELAGWHWWIVTVPGGDTDRLVQHVSGWARFARDAMKAADSAGGSDG